MKRLFMIRRSAVVVCLTAALAVSTTVRGDASSVNSLKIEKQSGSSSFVISKMGAVDVQDFVMEEPPRLVLDFLGAKHDLSENKFDGDGQFVRRVRSSQFSFEPDQVTRIVFDLEADVSYEVSNLSQSVTVRFFPKKNGRRPVEKPGTMKSSMSPADLMDAARAIKPIPPKNVVKAADKDSESDGAGSKSSSAWATSTPKTDSKAGTGSKEQPATKPVTVTTWNPPAMPAQDKAARTNNNDSGKHGTQTGMATASSGTKADKDDSGAKPETAQKTQPKPAMPVWMKPSPAAQTNTKTGARSSGSDDSSRPVRSNVTRAEPMQPKPVTSSSKTSWLTPSDARKRPSQPKITQGGRAFQAGLVRNRNMTIDVQNASIKTVLRSVSEFSNTNIIFGPEVESNVTAHLKNVPWRQALDLILKSHGFGWREEYGIIRVSTLDKLTKEELELQAAARKKDDLMPLSTRIMPLSFANADEMKKALKDVLTKRGTIQVETGNNALIVSDIDKALDKVEGMVAELDRRTRQVEIVAKMVDVDFEASREMGIRWDALNLSSGSANAVGDAVIDARSAAPAGTFRIGTVQSWGQVELAVDVLEKENRANIISNPRVVTADNREANILVGKQIPLIVSDEAGNPITELTKVGIILRVTPHVNKDNSITLDLHPEVSELSAQATVQGGVIISLSEADTRLVVGNGETAVLGGLINEVESTLESGVPVLKDLPVIGSLFKLNSKTKKKRELIIFVTPRIVDTGMEVGMDSDTLDE